MSVYLIARIGDTRLALRSQHIESVVIARDAVPVPRAAAHVAGLFALRSRVLTLIDPHVVLGLRDMAAASGGRAVVIDIDGHGYGLLVDAADEAVVIEAPESDVPGRLDPAWERVVDGMINHDGESLLVIEPTRFVTSDLAQAA